MIYPAFEKAEIIRLVGQSHLPLKQPLAKLDIPKAVFHRWYDLYRPGDLFGSVIGLTIWAAIIGSALHPFGLWFW
jgi:hypothetical protein